MNDNNVAFLALIHLVDYFRMFLYMKFTASRSALSPTPQLAGAIIIF